MIRRDDRRGHHVRVDFERSPDFVGFDSIAADLDLLVGATEVIDVVRGVPTGQVAGAVHALARFPRAREKTLGRQGGLSPVATRDTRAGQIQLTCNARQRRLKVSVDDVRTRVEDGSAHARCIAVGKVCAERVDRVLGRAVQVVRLDPGSVAQLLPQPLRHGLTTERNEHDSRCIGRHRSSRRTITFEQAFVDQHLPVRRRDIESVDACAVVMREQSVGVAAQFVVDDMHLVAVQQPEQLLPRGIERERRGVRDFHTSSGLVRDDTVEDLLDMVDVHVRQAAVAHGDALRPARRAGGEDDVRKVIELDPATAVGISDRARVEGRNAVAGGGIVEVDAAGVTDSARVPTGHQRHRWTRETEHVADAIVGQSSVDRHIRRTDGEHREHRDDHALITWQEERDAMLGPDTLLEK